MEEGLQTSEKEQASASFQNRCVLSKFSFNVHELCLLLTSFIIYNSSCKLIYLFVFYSDLEKPYRMQSLYLLIALL